MKSHYDDISKKQKEILTIIYKYRFITVKQIQVFLNHTTPQRTQAWLKDLHDKKYVKRKYDPKTFNDKTKPAIYYLAPKSRIFIAKHNDIALSSLVYLYQEHRRTEKFITHCLFIIDIHHYLLKQKDPSEDLQFFTKVELSSYDYFPDPFPDAYIAVKGKNRTRRYFLEFFDEYSPSWVARQRVKYYLEYSEKKDWDKHTNGTPLPSILFVFHSDKTKKHIHKYARALLEKSYEDKISFYLTCKTQISTAKNTIWQKVE